MYLGYNPAKANPDSPDETTYAIYAGTDFGGDGNDPGFRQGIEPYFSVTWDGTLFARKGTIANTWTIDDTSLTYKVLSTTKNNDLTNENIYDKSHEIYVVAHANGESFNYGKEPGLYDFTDGEYNLLYDYAYTQEAILLMNDAKAPLLAYDPEMAEDPSAGNYRYIKEFHDGQSVYTCSFDFYME